MGYLLAMSMETHDWLAELAGSDPRTAAQVGEALTALMTSGPALGPPLVISLADPPSAGDPREALDLVYQEKVGTVQAARRLAADAATVARDARARLAELESDHARLSGERQRALAAGDTERAGQLADAMASAQQQGDEVRLLLSKAASAERRLEELCERRQRSAEALRIRKETLKASYTAAESVLRVNEILADPAAARTDEDPDDQIAQAAGRLREVSAEISRELGQKPWPAGLMELRPGAAGDGEVRIVFGIEPAGTALLIAVLDGREAVRDHRQEAVILSAEVLRNKRAGRAPEAAARAYQDTRSFLAEFFAGSAAEIERGAAALEARNRARTLAEQRQLQGLSQAEVARRMGVRQERVSAIERAQPGATEIRTLASYIEALGGRMEITAEFGGERVLLR